MSLDDHDETPPTADEWGDDLEEPSPIAIGDMFDRAFGGSIEAWMERARLEHEAHAAQCRAQWCDLCGRHACIDCRRVAVDDYDRACRDCRIERIVRGARLPKRYLDADLYNDRIMSARVKSRSAVERVRRNVRPPKRAFVGASGQGKTTLAAANLRAFARYLVANDWRQSILFVSALDLEAARLRHPLGSETEAELVEEAMEVDLLILDDIGAEGPRGADVISAVIHRRYDDDKPLWFTTGISAEAIASKYSGGVERRLFEGADIIDCGGRQ